MGTCHPECRNCAGCLNDLDVGASKVSAVSDFDCALTDLHNKALTLTEELKNEILTLEKTLEFSKDFYGVKMRAFVIQDMSNKLIWIAAKMDAIRDIKYRKE